MRTLKLFLVLAVVVMSLCASGMTYAADGNRGGGHSGGYSRGGGGHSGGYYGGGGGHYGGRSGGYYRGGGHSGGYYRGGGHYGGHNYWGHHGGFDFDVVIGGPFGYYPYSYYPYYYPSYYPYYNPYYYPYSPAATAPSMPQEYIERSEDESSYVPSDVWYYCPKSRAYYPYVKKCPGGWQEVPAQPPSGSGR